MPPPRVLAHHHNQVRQWTEDGGSIDLHDRQGRLIGSQPILVPEYIGPYISGLQRANLRKRKLKYIIVACNISAIFPTLRVLTPNIGRTTTILLLGDWLGVVEQLNKQVFQDPSTRPRYIVGRLTHTFARYKQQSMAVRDVSHFPSKSELSIALCPEEPEEPRQSEELGKAGGPAGPGELAGSGAWRLAPNNQANMKQLLIGSKRVHVSTKSPHLFLHQQLPRVVFSAVADSMSVALGCRYSELRDNVHSRLLYECLLDECLQICGALPEFNKKGDEHTSERMAKLRALFTGENFKILNKWHLKNQARQISPWITMIRMGTTTPVDFVNGWLARRAQELGLRCDYNMLMISLVKSRHRSRLNELRSDVPLGYKPYMMDGDLLGGKQSHAELALQVLGMIEGTHPQLADV